MTRPASSLFLGVALVCAATVACSSAPTDHVGKDGKPVNGELSPNDPNGTQPPPNPNHDEGDPDPQDDQGEQPGPTCDVTPAPIPDGWKTYSMTGFSVSVPGSGYTADSVSPTLMEFFPATPGTLLAASADTHGSMDGAVAAWKAVLGGKTGTACQVTTEETTYVCDPAIAIHASCMNERTVEVMLVQHGDQVYFTSCELGATGDKDTCAKFMTTLRFE